jgi:hypothetical protein
MYFRKTDTTAASSLRDGSLVGITDSGNLTYLANDSTDRVLGVCRLRVAAADTTGWPGAPLVPVEVPVENAVEWLVDADSDGAGADSNVGRFCSIDTETDSDSESTRIDVSDTVQRTFLITGNPDSDRVIGIIAKSAFAAVRDLSVSDTVGTSIL